MGFLVVAGVMSCLRYAARLLSRMPVLLALGLLATALAQPARAQLALLEPGAATQFVVKGLVTPGGMGDEQLFSVLALDANQNIAIGYRGTVRFSSTDATANLPANYTFTANDSGQKTFRIKFNSKATHTVTATDTSNSSITGTHAPIVINNLATISSTTVSYNSSTNSITVAGALTVTLSQIKSFLPSAPLDQVSTGVWLLRANLLVQKGARLLLKGVSAGGDVNELRLLSNNSGSLITNVIYVEANYGRIEIDRTKIISWNQAASGPDTNHVTNDRAFLRAISALHSDGVTKRESRMDILNSEIAYLGYDYNQRTSRGGGSYGIGYRVGGSDLGRFAKVDVFGDILNSNIHHNYMGYFSFGSFGANLSNNTLTANVLYGWDPHDDSDYLIIRNNRVSGSSDHGIIASKRCDHIVIMDNESSDNGRHGIQLHRTSDHGLIQGNNVHDNGEDGISLFDTFFTLVRNNTVTNNTKNGIRLSVASADNVIMNNEVTFNDDAGLRFYKGTDTPTNTSDDGHPKRNQYIGNTLSGNANAIDLVEADENVFKDNTFDSSNGEIGLEQGCSNVFDNNTIAEVDAIHVVTAGSCSSKPIPFDVRVTNQKASRVHLSAGKLQFFSQSGAIFDFDTKADIATTYKTIGSELALTTSNLGTSPVVVRSRDLGITGMGSQSVFALPVAWGASGAEKKEWTAKTSSSAVTLGYKLPGLLPQTSYRLRRNGAEIAIILSDSQGNLSFNESTGTSDVRFTVERP